MRLAIAYLSLFAAIGCGGDDSSGGLDPDGGGAADAGADGSGGDGPVFTPGRIIDDPIAIPGGGVGSGSIDGQLNVFVVDAYRDTPIVGASVRVGGADAETLIEGTTGSDGLVVLEDSRLSGPQVVTARATGHATATWFGVSGAVVTIPLRAHDAVPPSATVSGTIEGWADIPVFPPNMLVALVWYSATADPLAPDNTIRQGSLPGNACFRLAPADPCNWTLKTRTGKLAIFATLYEVDTKGTPNENDDEHVLLGYAFRRGFDLSANEQLSDQVLVRLDSSDLVTPDATWDTPPAGQPFVSWTPVLRLGQEGQVPILDPTGQGTRVPGLAGEIASATYAVLGVAQPLVENYPNSSTLAHDVDIGSEVDLGVWLPPPEDLDAADGVYSFTPTPEASVHVVDYSDFDEVILLWSVTLLDGSTSFRLPALSPDPLDGNVAMTVRGFELPGYSALEFSWASLLDRFQRVSTDYILLP